MAGRKVYQGKAGKEYTKSKNPPQRHEENKVQKPLVRVLRQIEAYTGLLTFFHVPNQLMRWPNLRKIFGGLGVRAGVPDLVIPIRDGKVIFIECKYKDGRTSKDQDEYIENLKRLGHIVEIIEAADAAGAQEQLFAILAKYGMDDFRFVHPKDRS